MDGWAQELEAVADERRVIRFSIVILTFSRDETVRCNLAHLRAKLRDLQNVEVVLVDNNPDTVDRSDFLKDFPLGQTIKVGANKGVSARNDGIDAARGEIVVLLDDDVFVQTPDFLERFGDNFEKHPEVGLVTVKKLDGKTMTLLPECIPHTRKTIDAAKPFLTFRFVGGLVGLRKSAYASAGGFSPEFFFGLEEHEYSYRLIEAGWKIRYEPDILAIETNDPNGRVGRSEMLADVLCNRYMIAFLHMPPLSMVMNMLLYTVFLYAKERGRFSIVRAVRSFHAWLRKPGRAVRTPIDRRTRAYIAECGGVTWR